MVPLLRCAALRCAALLRRRESHRQTTRQSRQIAQAGRAERAAAATSASKPSCAVGVAARYCSTREVGFDRPRPICGLIHDAFRARARPYLGN